jgi:uncharacterized membrane protein (DUF4010 family)
MLSGFNKPVERAVDMGSGIRSVLLVQFLLVAALSIALLVFYGIWPALAAGYGGGVAAVNALLLARCARRDAEATERTPGQSLTAAYVCVIQRFLAIALLFGLGMAAMKLPPLAMLASFIGGQLVMVISGTRQLQQN